VLHAGAEVIGRKAGSLKTEEKARFDENTGREEKPAIGVACFDEPTSAPTGNWFAPDRTNACQRWNVAP
jgi:hypothetical protein